ncbi:DegT/DnrJ/EryC1/StrS family aminotransferase [Azoarcus taiwanensis]|nr:DegT/DnrJ/EryC1/StrS family aminotransferase [Azoarcus taiwanensis]
MSLTIPMVDLQIQYQTLQAEIDTEVAKVLGDARFILGPNVHAFEEEVAAYLGVAHAVSCASGTDALHLALRAADVGPGDEVITTPFTFIATAEAICYVGATPVFVDIDPLTFNIDIARVEAAISERTAAVLPVHLYGQPADMKALRALCDAHRLWLIEDCAQSFGARAEGGAYTGSIGEFGCFSFFPSKNLGCYGDGGLVTTSTETMANRLRKLRNHGSSAQYEHDLVGYNSRLDEIQAAVLRIKLRHIDRFNASRRAAAQRYDALLEALPLRVPCRDPHVTHVFHQYTVLCKARDLVVKALRDAGIACAIYYPRPLHQQKAFSGMVAGVSLPVTEGVARDCLSLPMYPELTDAQAQRVAEVLAAAL